MHKVIIGSRGSDLALWQAEHVKGQLEALGCEVEIKVIKTQGDLIQHLSFDKLEGKGFFTKEIEASLLNKDVDLAVHSHKDLETNPPEGLIIAAVSPRANPEDILIIHPRAFSSGEKYNLKKGALVGTSSARRKSQMFALFPGIEIEDLRGNVPTRIQKLRDGQYDAILLARAGVERLELDLSDVHVSILDPNEFVPAPAQGVLGLQVRSNDKKMIDLLAQINDLEVQKQIEFERKVLNLMEGGCQLPLGVYCNDKGDVKVSYNSGAKSERHLLSFNIQSTSPEQVASQLKSL